MNELITKAMTFAQSAHNVQKYGDCYPYFKHLQDVYDILIEFGFTEKNDLDLLVAAWLHDTIEDTNTSFGDIRSRFGLHVADIVYCLTDELGRNRKERKEKTYPKIRSNPESIIIKVADRIANVRFSSTQDSGHIKMYQDEFTEFQYQLRIYKQIDSMWEHLEKITFQNIATK